MVSKEVVESYHNIMKEFAPFAEQGWLCEGGSDEMGRLRNIIFNNETNGYVSADYSGRIYVYENVDKMTAHTCDFSHELAVPILLCRNNK